ncbi:S8 family serine peptidase [Paenibacillus graminis]|uniref:S8 family serine peptidase n=1 Tax=Paenibacillus graminis TaxID=189425 RepID=UPI000471839F|nr:S8 family serine peptidase [Paenibacillus graminis]
MKGHNPIDVCLIDDGVNEYPFDIGTLKYNKEIKDNLKIINRNHYDQHQKSHGTVCAGIIKKYAPAARLSSVKILNDKNNRKGTTKQLITALYWCLDNHIKIVNLSLGSTYFLDFAAIRDCVNDVAEQGIIMVAASNNNGLFTLPASLTNVIGVKSSGDLHSNQYVFDPYPYDGIDVITSGKHSIPSEQGEVFETNSSNSFAAPFITGRVHEILTKHPFFTLDDIKTELNNNSISNESSYNPCLMINTDWMIKEKEYTISNLKDGVYEIGMLPQGNMNEHKVKIWSSEFYGSYIRELLKKMKTVDPPVPVILIRGFLRKEFSIALDHFFHKDKFYPVRISDHSSDIFDGFEYLPEETGFLAFFGFIHQKYKCDVIIFVSEASDSDGFGDYPFDITINLLERNYSNKKHFVYDYNPQEELMDVSIYLDHKTLSKDVRTTYKSLRKVLTS